MSERRAMLALADGTTFVGRALGAEGTTTGEVVFTTGMTGYQEVLTDPSYSGQIVTMTAPEIGNTGLNEEDGEDARPRLAGYVVREASNIVSNWRADESLDGYLARHGVVGIEGIDTRALTRHLRDHGSQNGAIGLLSDDNTAAREALVRKAREAPNMEGLDLATGVSCKVPYAWKEGTGLWKPAAPGAPNAKKLDKRVVAFDFGIKRNILRCLVDAGCDVTVVPSSTSAAAVLDLRPDGVFLSNGPGDPAAVKYAIETVRALLGKKPIFGICLGHQILGLALGATTSKLRFGHRGINQPVRDLTTGRIEITTQNHGFVVDVDSIGDAAAVTHLHLNDGSVEGLAHKTLPAFSVQYHPESAAGPHDSLYLFERFTSAF